MNEIRRNSFLQLLKLMFANQLFGGGNFNKRVLAAKMKSKAVSKRPVFVVSKTKRRGGYNVGRMNSKPKTELKAIDVASTALDFTQAGALITLNIPTVGAELYQRVGRKIYMQSVHIRGIVTLVATSLQDLGRMIIVYDSQPNATTFALADLLKDSNAAAASTANSEINLNNRQRFKILRDDQLLLSAGTFTAGVLTNFTIIDPIKNSYNIDMFIPLNGLETIYNATNGGTASDITSGALYLFNVSQSGTSKYSLLFHSRLRYYD